jgi:hypothetical protein
MTGTPVEKTYVMLMVADMTRVRFYTEAFAVRGETPRTPSPF